MNVPLELVIEYQSASVAIATVASAISKVCLEESFDTIMRYAIHELVHSLQHMNREGKADPYKEKEYLDRPDEAKAFKAQVKEIKRREGDGEVQENVHF